MYMPSDKHFNIIENKVKQLGNDLNQSWYLKNDKPDKKIVKVLPTPLHLHLISCLNGKESKETVYYTALNINEDNLLSSTFGLDKLTRVLNTKKQEIK